GTDRASGGPFEQAKLQLHAFGPDGLSTRYEWFDVDDIDAALARFDELTTERPAATAFAGSVRRRVRPNAATANLARVETAIVARDADALDAGLADDAQLIDHTTGAVIDREGSLSTLCFTFKGRDATYRTEPFATLGDSLVLTLISASGAAFAGGRFDVGAYETEKIGVTDVDAQGRRQRMEIFAHDRLADAVVRAYERYAELLPEGAARDRAARTARSLRSIVALDPNPAEAPLDDDVEFVDHRRLGFEPARGAGAFVRHFRALLDLAIDLRLRIDDVLDLRPDTLLYRSTVSGTDRASGGPF